MKDQNPVCVPSENIKISVILPVWNPGDGIGRCIRSLQAQRLKEIEMIFVDDRGTDGAMEKVRDAAASDLRIRILVNPENLGAGPSRNRGIAAARGKYLAFLDPDDCFAEGFLYLLYEQADAFGADIAKGVYVYRYDNGKELRRAFPLNDRIRLGLAQKKPLFTLFTYEHCSAIYRRTLFEDGNVRYGCTRRDQDTLFLLRICTKTERIVLCDQAEYIYFSRPGSVMDRSGENGWKDPASAFSALLDCILEHHRDDKWARVYVLELLNHRLCQYYALKDKPGFQDFIEGIRRSVLRLPFAEKLKEDRFPIRVLLDYGICLPDDAAGSHWSGKKYFDRFRLISDYFRFAAAYPRLSLKCGRQILMILRKMLLSAAERIGRH